MFISLFLKRDRVLLQQHASSIFDFNDLSTFTENVMSRTTMSKAFASVGIKSNTSFYRNITNIIRTYSVPANFDTKNAYFYIENTQDGITVFMTDIKGTPVHSGQFCVVKKENNKPAVIQYGRIYTEKNNISVPIKLTTFTTEMATNMTQKSAQKAELVEQKKLQENITLTELDKIVEQESLRGARAQVSRQARENAELKQLVESLRNDLHNARKRETYRDNQIAALTNELSKAAKREQYRDNKIDKLEKENTELQQKVAVLENTTTNLVQQVHDHETRLTALEQPELTEFVSEQTSEIMNQRFLDAVKKEASSKKISIGFIQVYTDNILRRFHELIQREKCDIENRWKISVVASQVVRELLEIRYKNNVQLRNIYGIVLQSDEQEISKIVDIAKIDDELPAPLRSKSFVTMCMTECAKQSVEFNRSAAKHIAEYAVKHNKAWSKSGSAEDKINTIRKAASTYRNEQIRKRDFNMQLEQELRIRQVPSDIDLIVQANREAAELASVRGFHRL